HAGFTYLLPYLEQDNVHRLYHYDVSWYDRANYDAVACEVRTFYCPSNRTRGSLDLRPYVEQWGAAMPPSVGATDYVLCKGATAGRASDPALLPAQARGLFNIAQAAASVVDGQFRWGPTPRFRVRLTDVSDGLSSAFAIGEGAGGNPRYLVADLNNPSQAVT